MKRLKLKAYAKVNLALDVLRRREDGYHDVKMVMQNLDIYDELEFTAFDEGEGITLESNRPEIPTDERNLVYRAINLMFEEYGIEGKIHVKLTKNIPIEAGMAGGSTDCAAALKAVNELFSLGADEQRLMELGVKLGADVPYCIMGCTALSEGIGERLTKISALPDCDVLVVKPPIGVSTGMVYNNLKLKELKSHPDVDGMVAALAKGDFTEIGSYMENVLEAVTVKLYPEIGEIKKMMTEHGAIGALMSGSGPTVFGLFTDADQAWNAAMAISEGDYATEIYVTRPV